MGEFETDNQQVDQCHSKNIRGDLVFFKKLREVIVIYPSRFYIFPVKVHDHLPLKAPRIILIEIQYYLFFDEMEGADRRDRALRLEASQRQARIMHHGARIRPLPRPLQSTLTFNVHL